MHTLIFDERYDKLNTSIVLLHGIGDLQNYTCVLRLIDLHWCDMDGYFSNSNSKRTPYFEIVSTNRLPHSILAQSSPLYVYLPDFCLVCNFHVVGTP